MIKILDYSAWLAELKETVNKQSLENKIEKVVMAVDESHIIKRVGDEPGIILVASFPDADKEVTDSDKYDEENKVLLFLLQKVSAGQQTIDEELQHYAAMQSLVEVLKNEIINMNHCRISLSGGIHTEWEYNAFGGFNGLSLGLSLKDYD